MSRVKWAHSVSLSSMCETVGMRMRACSRETGPAASVGGGVSMLTPPTLLRGPVALGIMPSARRTEAPEPAGRPALAPALLAALVLFGGLALLDSDAYLYIRFGVCILAMIVAVMAVQARRPWWIIGLAPVIVVW